MPSVIVNIITYLPAWLMAAGGVGNEDEEESDDWAVCFMLKCTYTHNRWHFKVLLIAFIWLAAIYSSAGQFL